MSRPTTLTWSQWCEVARSVDSLIVQVRLGTASTLASIDIANSCNARFFDCGSQEALAESVAAFKGAVVIVSHDQYFVSRVAKEVWVVGEECDAANTEARNVMSETVPAVQRIVRQLPSFEAYVEEAYARTAGSAKQ